MVQAVLEDTLFSDEFTKHISFVLSDPRSPDNPIIYASDTFFKTTGYGPKDILGRNCRLLQGPGTSRQAVMEIRDAIREERDASVCLRNYRKDGGAFWNAFYLSPVRGPSGCVEYYVGIQADVTSLVEGSGPVDEASVHAVAAEELAQARRIAEDMRMHAPELLQRCKHTCAVDDSVPSSLLSGLSGIQSTFVLTDPSKPDNPMVFCSPAFLKMTGYSCTELCGRNCRILQGPETDPAAIQQIRDALAATPPRPVTVALMNYRKDGSKFMNGLHIAPIRDARGTVQFFCGVQLELAERQQGVASGEAAMLGCSEGSEETAAAVGGPPVEPTPVQLLQQKGVVGAVRVASRALSAHGLRRASVDQHPPRAY